MTLIMPAIPVCNTFAFMDQTRLHLFITHLPVFGAALGLIVLLLGMRWKNSQTIKAAWYLLLLTALGAAVAYVTGEAAEETVEHMAGISEEAIEEHEDAAIFALWAFIILGVISLAALVFPNRKWSRYTPPAMVFLTTFSLVIALRTANLGGSIRHTELANPAVVEVPQQRPEEVRLQDHPKISVTTDDGKKWDANPETTTAIATMLGRVSAMPANPSTEQVKDLRKHLEDDFSGLVKQCTMTGEAHDQLHNYILPLRDSIEELDQRRAAKQIPALKEYLLAYQDYFR